MNEALNDLRGLLNRYTQPCSGDCEHSQCPLLRELHAIHIKNTLKEAQITVRPIVNQERKGEFVGNLMDMRLRH